MFILPFNEKWFDKIPFERDSLESFYPRLELQKFNEFAQKFLENSGFSVKKVKESIAGKFKGNVAPHEDSMASDFRHTAAFIKPSKYSNLHFFGDNGRWIEFNTPVCIIFDNNKTHAILNETRKPYAWFATNVKFAKGYKHSYASKSIETVYPGLIHSYQNTHMFKVYED